jgi:hypothetical protein
MFNSIYLDDRMSILRRTLARILQYISIEYV